MKRIALVFILLLPIVGCGWNETCLKNTSYSLGAETISVTGTPMVQQFIGCLVTRYEPLGLHRTLWNRQAYTYNAEPPVLKEMIYAGREGSTLHITYREYSVQGYARAAFFQNLYYDLKTSDKIVFQENVIQVLEANNYHIRFKVLQGWTSF